MPGREVDAEMTPWARIPIAERRLTTFDVRKGCSRMEPGQLRKYAFTVPSIKEAAAFIPIVDSLGEAAVVVTKRPSTMEFHKDDWVFPGGRVEAARDRQPLDTALRELDEELGIPRRAVEPLGHLATYGPLATGFLLHVYVGIISAPEQLVPDIREVAETVTVRLSEFMKKGAYFTGSVIAGHDPGPLSPGAVGADSTKGGRLRFFALRENEYLWGLQAEILWDLLSLLLKEMR